MTDHKKPGMAFWVTAALVVLLVAYPLSFGPIIWLNDHGELPGWAWLPIYRLYKPVDHVACNAPEPFRNFMFWYL